MNMKFIFTFVIISIFFLTSCGNKKEETIILDSKDLEKIVNKYQISINKLISMSYLKALFPNENIKLPDMVRKVNEGYNLNEVVLSSKKSENISFFEKFFHFFT